MNDPTVALTRQLLEWIDGGRRTRAEVLEAWKTSCPRLSIWEDACIEGLIDGDPDGGFVTVSAKGRHWLRQSA